MERTVNTSTICSTVIMLGYISPLHYRLQLCQSDTDIEPEEISCALTTIQPHHDLLHICSLVYMISLLPFCLLILELAFNLLLSIIVAAVLAPLK